MTHGPRPALALALPALAGALIAWGPPALAQQDAAKGDSLERAQKAADAVFHWIKLNADKGASRQQPAASPAPAPKKAAPAPAAPRPAAAPTPTPVAVATPSAAPPAAASVTPPPALAPSTAQAQPDPEPERTHVVLASAAPTPAPAAPLAVAAQAAEPPAARSAPEEAEEPLRLLNKVEPVLPRQLQQQGNFRSGMAQVQFTVAPDGSVSQASVIKATHARLGTAAVDAVRQWRFAPVRKARDAAVEVAFTTDSD